MKTSTKKFGKGSPNNPEKSIPLKPDKNPDPTKKTLNDPKKVDPTRIVEPKKPDPNRTKESTLF
jgi:hypothetical protein